MLKSTYCVKIITKNLKINFKTGIVETVGLDYSDKCNDDSD